jgi:hypothetical protein
MANINSSDLAGRSLTSMVNRNKISTIYDFPYGSYRAQRTFYDELSRIQSSLVNDGKVTLETGQVADIDSVGGLLAIQINMETLETRQKSMEGLSSAGLANEKKLWTLQN